MRCLCRSYVGPTDLFYVHSCRFLHSEAFYAVAQKKYVFIYDQSGTEIQWVLQRGSTFILVLTSRAVHSKMKQHIDVTRMEFLPYHYLLATVVSSISGVVPDTPMLTPLPRLVGQRWLPQIPRHFYGSHGRRPQDAPRACHGARPEPPQRDPPPRAHERHDHALVAQYVDAARQASRARWARAEHRGRPKRGEHGPVYRDERGGRARQALGCEELGADGQAVA